MKRLEHFIHTSLFFIVYRKRFKNFTDGLELKVCTKRNQKIPGTREALITLISNAQQTLYKTENTKMLGSYTQFFFLTFFLGSGEQRHRNHFGKHLL